MSDPDARLPSSVAGALRAFVKERRGLMIAYFTLVGVNLLLVTAVPLAIARLVQKLQGNSSKVLSRAVFLVAVLWLVKEIVVIVLKAMDQFLVPYFRLSLTRWVTESVLTRPPPDSHNRDNRANAIENAAKLPHVVVNVTQQFRQDILPLLIRGMGIVLGFWLLGWRFGVISTAHFAISMLLLGIGAYLGVRRRVRFGEHSNAHQVAIADTLQNVRSINAAGTVREEQQRLRKIDNGEILKRRVLKRESTVIWNLVALINTVFVVGGLFWLMRRIAMDGMSGPAAGAVAMIFYQSGSVDIALMEFELLIEHISSAREADRFVQNLPPPVVSTPELSQAALRVITEAATASRGVEVRLLNVTYRYPGSRDNVLQHLSLHFEAGHAYVLRAPSGAGKSTIMRLILGEIVPSAGNVEIAGLPPAYLSPPERSQLIEYVPQLPTLFSRTILENIMYNRQTIVAGTQLEKDRRAVRALLAELKLDSDPAFDLDRSVGPNGSLLSGGQRRIICLMRAYFRSHDGRKPLLLLDEPLVNLGLHMREAALQMMRRLVLNRTVIAISHDPKFPSNFKPVRI